MTESTRLDNRAPDVGESALRPGRVLAVACLAHGMIVVDTSIVHVAIPSIRADLDASLPTMQFVVTSYVVVIASLLLAGAAAVGRYGAVRMFRLGVVLFGVTSVLCGLAPDGAVLVAMRASQGLGAVLLMPAVLVMLTDTYQDQAKRAKAMSIWSMCAGSPVAFGPTLGGALVETVGWRSIFWINVPVVLLVLWLSARHMPRGEQAAAKEPQDVPGQLLSIVFLGSLALALAEGQDLGWTRPLPVAAAAVAVIAFAAFVIRQRTYAYPLIPGDLFRAPGFRGFVTVGLLLFVAYNGLMFTLSVFLQQVRGYDPVTTGLCFLSSALPITFMPLVAGRFDAKFGARKVLGAGIALSLAGGLLLVAVGSRAPLGTCLGLVFVGIGFGLATVPQITLVMAAAPAHRSAIAGGLMSAGRSTGSLIGVALLAGLQSGNGIAAPAFVVLVVYVLMALAAFTGGRGLPADAAK
ncbi:MFS transporter [Streptomyces sp. V3I7]|uniref:MFS transporter n=1 Tax=Streptomyces sp. V3I7 TaxID=3042278 RepID=UPI002783F221|nr:MFS transporter [Streptomyces sp. V3I7]MDQ0989460.1 DHA2 family methylenomycin A resistance protein-like MFS transporter [Streptomyces sp. V3I7]